MDIIEIARIVAEAGIGFLLWHIQRRLERAEETEREMQAAMAEERTHVEEMRQANNRGTQALLRDRLLQGYHFFMKRGVVTYGEARNFENMYEAYHALGKNGVMDSIYKQFQTIPVKSNAEVYPDEPEGGEEE